MVIKNNVLRSHEIILDKKENFGNDSKKISNLALSNSPKEYNFIFLFTNDLYACK